MLKSQNFDWQGHRGARGLLPENSLPAFTNALALGVTTLEMDVVISRDSQVVVSHEPWFSPEICLTPEGKPIPDNEHEKYNIFQYTYDEIKTFDCGTPENTQFPDQVKIPVRKPLLTDVFRLAEKYCRDEMRNEIHYNIEIKSNPEWEGIFHPDFETFSELVFKTVDAYITWKRVTIQSFDSRVLKYYHEHHPEVMLSVLEENEQDPGKVLESLGFIPAVYSPYFKLLKQENVEWLHEKNIRVIPWTVNDPGEMKSLIEMGVDGIITDYPNLIWEIRTE